MKKAIFVVLVLSLFILKGLDVSAKNTCKEALKLYQQVISGERQLEDLTVEEQRLVVLAYNSSFASDEKLEGYEFSLKDIESKCEVYKYSAFEGDISCWEPALKPVMKNCEAYFSGPELGIFNCNDTGLMVIEESCTVHMYDESYGSISCKLSGNFSE